MVSINITTQELLQRTQTQLAAVLIQRDILDERLNACAAVMTPEQLRQAGLALPGQAPDAPSEQIIGEPVVKAKKPPVKAKA